MFVSKLRARFMQCSSNLQARLLEQKVFADEMKVGSTAQPCMPAGERPTHNVTLRYLKNAQHLDGALPSRK